MSPNLPQGGEAAKLDRKQLLGGGVFVNNTAFRGTWEQQFKKKKKGNDNINKRNGWQGVGGKGGGM